MAGCLKNGLPLGWLIVISAPCSWIIRSCDKPASSSGIHRVSRPDCAGPSGLLGSRPPPDEDRLLGARSRRRAECRVEPCREKCLREDRRRDGPWNLPDSDTPDADDVERVVCLRCGAGPGPPCRARAGAVAGSHDIGRFKLVPQVAKELRMPTPAGRWSGQPGRAGRAYARADRPGCRQRGYPRRLRPMLRPRSGVPVAAQRACCARHHHCAGTAHTESPSLASIHRALVEHDKALSHPEAVEAARVDNAAMAGAGSGPAPQAAPDACARSARSGSRDRLQNQPRA
jgi:hypothetical protein